MKKLRIVLAIVAMLAIIATNVFAAESTAITYDSTTVEYTEGENLTITLRYSAETADVIAKASLIRITYDNTVWTVAGCSTDVTDATASDAGTYVQWQASKSDVTPIEPGTVVLAMEFALKAGADPIGTTFTCPKQTNVLSDTTKTYLAKGLDAFPALTVVAAEVVVPDPVPSVTANTVVAGATDAEGYTDVPTFTGSVTVENAAYLGSKKVMLTPSVYENGTLHKTYDAVELDGLTIDESGNIAFKLAVIGAPEDVDVTASATAELVD